MVSNPAGQVYHRFGAGKSVRERVSPQLHALIFELCVKKELFNSRRKHRFCRPVERGVVSLDSGASICTAVGHTFGIHHGPE
jgi:hypothetical protein